MLRLNMMYKIHNGLVAMDPQDHMTPIRRKSRYVHTLGYEVPRSQSTNYHHYSFFPRTIRDWNRLPETTVQAPNLNAFKRRLSNPNECEHTENHVDPALGLYLFFFLVTSSTAHYLYRISHLQHILLCLYPICKTCTVRLLFFKHSPESSCRIKKVGNMEDIYHKKGYAKINNAAISFRSLSHGNKPTLSLSQK